VEPFDVAVAGGGPAGCATVIRLAQAGRRVLLVDAGHGGRSRTGESAPPGFASLLDDLRLPRSLVDEKHRTSYGNVSAWGSKELQFTDFIHAVAGPGYQLDRAQFDASLLHAAVAAGVEVRTASRLRRAGSSPQGHALTVQGPDGLMHLTARWLVDAGGRSSTLLAPLGGCRIHFDRLLAFCMVTDARDGPDRDGRTWIEAQPGGWWYSALLPSGPRVFAYLSDRDLVDKSELLTAKGFMAALMRTEHLAGLCAANAGAPSGRPHGRNASTACLEALVGPDWVAVGDAALSFDPLSSQGIPNALHTGLLAADAVDDALCGRPGGLARYQAYLRCMFGSYVRHRRAAYRGERRWADQLFWRRRQGA
jgi:flavin-dependent dehydrogenase